MKNLLLFLLLCSLSISTSAQKIRFTDSSNVWRVAESVGVYTHYTYFFGNDTLIGDKHYRPLVRTYISESGDTSFGSNQYMIREDTVLGRVYYRDISLLIDTLERQLYVYNLNLGDTVNFGSYTDSVIAIDSLLIDGYYYKVYTMRDAGASTTLMHAYTYIEGIGALPGPGYPMTPLCFGEFSFALCCFQNKGTYPDIYLEYQNCEYDWVFDNDSCNCDPPPYSGINDVRPQRFLAEVVPHPLQPSSLLQWQESIMEGRLKVTDATGRNIVTKEVSNTRSMPIGQLIRKPGLYFYELTDIKNKRTARGKLVVF